MATIRIQAGNEGRGSGGSKRSGMVLLRSVAVGALLLTGAACAQAADSTDRVIPPSSADVALLRQLLALQHPTLRQGAVAQGSSPSAGPAVTTEPGQQPSLTPTATEGEACTSPGAADGKGCSVGAETSATRSAKLSESFRASLNHAMAAAGYDGARL